MIKCVQQSQRESQHAALFEFELLHQAEIYVSDRRSAQDVETRIAETPNRRWIRAQRITGRTARNHESCLVEEMPDAAIREIAVANAIRSAPDGPRVGWVESGERRREILPGLSHGSRRSAPTAENLL